MTAAQPELNDIIVPNQEQMSALEFKNLADRIEYKLSKLPKADLQLRHSFVNGIYIREVLMKAGVMTASKIHKTEHPFVILSGVIDVRTEEGVVLYIAPYRGVTKPGTRRILFAYEDTWWMTIHRTDKTTIEEAEKELTEDYENPLFLLNES